MIGWFSTECGYWVSQEAELWGTLMGLCLAWGLGDTKVILELDSQSVVDLVKEGPDGHKFWNLISPI